jgi:hypothetical protein
VWKSEPMTDAYISTVVDLVPVLGSFILTAVWSVFCLCFDNLRPFRGN